MGSCKRGPLRQRREVKGLFEKWCPLSFLSFLLFTCFPLPLTLYRLLPGWNLWECVCVCVSRLCTGGPADSKTVAFVCPWLLNELCILHLSFCVHAGACMCVCVCVHIWARATRPQCSVTVTDTALPFSDSFLYTPTQINSCILMPAHTNTQKQYCTHTETWLQWLLSLLVCSYLFHLSLALRDLSRDVWTLKVKNRV